MTVRCCQLLVLMLLFVAGCSSGSQPTAKAVNNDTPTQTVNTAAPNNMMVATIAEVEQLIANQNGKVVVLDLWALW